MIDLIKRCWKGVITVVGILGVITALVSFDSRYASSAAIEKLDAKTTAAIQEVKESMELDRNLDRLERINDNLFKAKLQQRQYPKDTELKEDIESLKKEKNQLQQKINNRK